tara:strand:+ start:242 stop:853 length:612 start_codon:yes stop_codon:yes gene_type:complete
VNVENRFQFWEDLYLEDNTGWDLKGPTPIFTELSKQLPKGDLCIIGCGRGYDAVTFAKEGFNVTAVDFAPSAIESLRNTITQKKLKVKVLQKNIFDLLPKYENLFDYVIEQTCFCAIHPSHRSAYEDVVRGILRTGGHLVGLWFPLDKNLSEGGPPYGTTIKEVKSYFNLNWETKREEFSQHSVKSRKNREKLIIFKKIDSVE